jgi:Tetratricopeptide repeat
MRGGLALLTLSGVLAMALAGTPAAAQTPSAEGKKAFDEGRKLADEHAYAGAIAAFERSLAIEPSIGASFNLAYCYEQTGRFADALASYRRALTLAQQKKDPRLADVNEAIRKLLEAHDHVVLKTPPDVAAAAGFALEVDGVAVPKADANGEVFRGGAEHTVRATATGREPSITKVPSRALVTVALGPVAVAAPPRPEPPAPAAASGGGWGAQRWAGVGLASAGLVSAGIGIVLGLKWSSDGEDLQKRLSARCANRQCPGGFDAEPGKTFKAEAEELDRDITRNSIITYGLAAALVAGGAVVFFTAPSAAPSSSTSARVRLVPQLGPRDASLGLAGAF